MANSVFSKAADQAKDIHDNHDTMMDSIKRDGKIDKWDVGTAQGAIVLHDTLSTEQSSLGNVLAITKGEKEQAQMAQSKIS